MHPYFGDVRDRFDEIYPTAASFVRLPSQAHCSGPHIRFHMDIDQANGAEQFSFLCYAYEDSCNWSEIPLVYDPEIPRGVVRWQRAAQILIELPIDRALEGFQGHCHALLQRYQE
jgi:hypothetical protein